MDHQRSSLPNVDRANSTLFRRYLDEQRKSILKTNFSASSARPIANSLQLQREYEESSTSQTKVLYPTVHLRKKSSHGRKFVADPTKQRSSHASRFLKRFQRQYKHGDAIVQQPKAAASSFRSTFEKTAHLDFYPPAPIVDPSHRNPCQRHAEPSLPPASTIPDEETPPIASTIRIEPTTFFIDPIQPELSDQRYAILNDLLNELSSELTDKPSVDILLEIEGSLAQRIYDCVVERDEENDEETTSHSTTTADSSASVVPMAKPADLPAPSPIHHHRDKYFQPIREPPSPPPPPPPAAFDLVRSERHSTPFLPLSKPLMTDLQSILEPVNLLRTVTTAHSISDDHEHWNLFSGFESNLFSAVKANDRFSSTTQQTLPFVNHLLQPRTVHPLDSANPSAFRPLDGSHSRSFPFPRPSIIDAASWFGQSQD